MKGFLQIKKRSNNLITVAWGRINLNSRIRAALFLWLRKERFCLRLLWLRGSAFGLAFLASLRSLR